MLLICGVLTLVVNQRERQAFSSNATVEAVQYQVGSDYGGIMVDQLVEPGASVREGDRLFTVSSFSLQKDLANGLEPVSTEAYEVDAETGLVTYLASADGTLEDFDARQGGYVPGGETVAVITQDDTAFVKAQFRLQPVDYARIRVGRSRRRRAAQPQDPARQGERDQRRDRRRDRLRHRAGRRAGPAV